ncbi:cysteine--tRNA ligase [Candidatus Anaplasma sp. TIGMIC]|uniref:cysteine--tRNA ligase n=1 Tax=Candidatus Anaplasma sp. TIGMIC TaxID=3020713 RepID=UPI00232EF664|nr:cysteine--tRNA ligase [Candidatus Anaplasma sp. TIGMIC]MDB1135382.1 cysteine--tRNA ligase [Candidatus Anaplasma sp. TIGMIC]
MKLYDTLSSTKKPFVPIDEACVRLYACGPTVYDLAHIGNARSAVVYDMLFRLLKEKYKNVVYVRNITDVDDKIIDAAEAAGQNIQDFVGQYVRYFHEDMKELNCLSPTVEPRATAEIEVMVAIIGRLIERGHAYVKNGSVYFNIASYERYGELSGRKIGEMIAGNRVEVDADKLHPGDFVLWKPATDKDRKLSACWKSPWGEGRPGWHIECSAMSYRYLGESFDIHGGGADLMFPHHENELAQNMCAFSEGSYARYWVHNGFLTVNGGEKMSKSLGNVITVRGLRESGISGAIIRYVFLCTHYRKPLDWNNKAVADAKAALDKISRACEDFTYDQLNNEIDRVDVDSSVICSLRDDMNTPGAISALHALVTDINKEDDTEEKLRLARVLNKSAKLMGITNGFAGRDLAEDVDAEEIERLIDRRKDARVSGDFVLADKIRDQLHSMGVVVFDEKDGTTRWRKN